jgi:phosphoribosylglycinamide formyltransferase, formyltetrahydrofolate-dependent
MCEPLRLGFLASGRGSNLLAILHACRAGRLPASPAVVISNNATSGALEIARRESVPGYHMSSKTHQGPGQLDRAMTAILKKHHVDLVVLAGYMKKIGPEMVAGFNHRIINIHPSLLPKYGGQGMYGLAVHEAVISAGEKETGVTIHLVGKDYDQGAILAQRRVPVMNNDTADILAARVLEVEHALYVEVLRDIISGAIALPDV